MSASGSKENDHHNYSLSVFFPCYNEEANIARVIEEALKFLPTLSNDFEIIIINDGSTDKTSAVVERFTETNFRIRIVNHHCNAGYGAALRSGFEAARKEFIFYTDGDGQFDISDLTELLPLVNKFDIISGYRVNRQDSLMRRINAYFWNLLVQRVLKFKCMDVDCAFKLYHRKIFDNISIKSTGALIDAEILARAVRAGYRIGEVPVRHKPRVAGNQTGANLKVILKAFKELLQLRKDILATPPA